MSTNPYQAYSPSGGPPLPPTVGPTPPHVMAPAVALVVVGVLNGLQSMYGLARNLLGANQGGPPPANIQDNPDLMQFYNAIQPYQGAINLTVSLLAVPCALLITFAGIQMLRRKMYPLCLTGSVLAAIPCLSFLACCMIGEGVGIWAFIVLLQQDVRQSFG